MGLLALSVLGTLSPFIKLCQGNDAKNRRRNKEGKGWKEEGIKKERRTERKKEFRGKGEKKRERERKEKKSLLLALNLSG